jgi:hypothetical protein
MRQQDNRKYTESVNEIKISCDLTYFLMTTAFLLKDDVEPVNDTAYLRGLFMRVYYNDDEQRERKLLNTVIAAQQGGRQGGRYCWVGE